MKKIKIKVTLMTNDIKDEYTTIANYDDEKSIISYQEKKDIVTNVELNLKNKELIRENKDFIMKYKFKLNEETTNQIYLKELEKYIDVKLKTKNYNYNNNKLEIEYILIDSNENVYYKIEY